VKFVVRSDDDRGVFVATLVIEQTELESADLSRRDKKLLTDCVDSTSISDKLLALGTIARRVEEGHQRSN